MTNPYAPVLTTQQITPAAPKQKRIQFAMMVAVIAVVGGYYYVMLRRTPAGSPVPLWPTLLLPLVVSVISAIRSKSIFLPPVTAVAGVTTGSIVFGMMRSWPAAELPVAFCVGLLLAFPSLFLAIRSSRKTDTMMDAKQSESKNSEIQRTQPQVN